MTKSQDFDLESVSDVQSVREGDIRKAQRFSRTQVALMAVQAIGTVYGDIGTSPLYVYSSTFSIAPTKLQVVCSLSMIIWTLVIMVTIKYIVIVLRADDENEGGTLALFTLLQRYSNISNRDPARPVKMERYLTQDLRTSENRVRRFIEGSASFRGVLTSLAIAGVCFVLSDGVLTPAQSVLGAIQGIEIINDTLGTWTIVGITCAILVVLFAIQPIGLNRLTVCYSPIIIAWLLYSASIGIYNMTQYDASVWKAWNPYYAGRWFTIDFADGGNGWHRLGGLLLCFTGVEALFADMGAFNRPAIQLSWLFFVLPCLILTYTGQAAYMAVDPSAYANPFYLTLPNRASLYVGLVLAILAAIVASQALITGTFQLLSQAINISYFPRLTVRHTSQRNHGQIYIGVANWLLMIGAIVVTCAYNNTTRLGNAYGLCVVLVTFITTSLVALVAIVVWRVHWLLVAPAWLVFALFDGLYLSAILFKVPKGAWFTLMLAAILASIMALYRYGKGKQWAAVARDKTSTKHVVQATSGPDGLPNGLHVVDGADNLNMIRGIGIYFDDMPDGAPSVWIRFLRAFNAYHQVTLFAHFRQVYGPNVPADQRYAFCRTSVPSCYRVVVRYGYADAQTTATLVEIADALRSWLKATLDDAPIASPEAVTIQAELDTLADACKVGKPVFLLDKTALYSTSTNPFKRLMLALFFFIRDNTRSRPGFWNLPRDQTIELGGSRAL